MSHTIVTFHYDGSDPSHNTGISEDEFENLSNGISNLGGYDIEFEKVDDEVADDHVRPKKPGQ